MFFELAPSFYSSQILIIFVNNTKLAVIGTLWVGAGVFLAQILGYLTRLLLSRELTVSEYGAVYSVITLFALMGLVQTMGLSGSLTPFIAKYLAKNDLPKAAQVIKLSFLVIGAISLLLFVLVFIFAEFIAAQYLGEVSYTPLIRIFSIAFLLSAPELLVQPLVQGFQRMDWSATVEFLRAAMLLSFTFLFLKLDYGVLAPLMAYSPTYLVLAIIGLLFVINKLPKLMNAHIEKQVAKPFLHYSLLIIFGGLGGLILNYTDTFLLTVFTNLEQVGLYQAALPTANILKIPNALVYTVMLPLIAALWSRGQKKTLLAASAELRLYLFIVMLPLCIGVFVFPQTILTLLFGGAFIQAALILQILAISSVFYIFVALNWMFFIGIESPKMYSKTILEGAVLNLFLNLLFISNFQAVGVALATLLAMIYMFVRSEFLLKRQLASKHPFRGYAGALISSIGFGLSLWFVRDAFTFSNQLINPIIAAAIGFSVYLCLLFLTRTVTIVKITTFLKRLV